MCLKQAKELLEPVLDWARTTQNQWREVELLALGAVYLSKTGEPEATSAMLDRALPKAAPGHFIRSFVDPGPTLRVLLEELSHRKRGREYRHSEYARTLLLAFEPPIQEPRRVRGACE